MKRIRLLFYLYAFFDDFILIYPFYAVMFADNGLTSQQISLLFAAWSITSFSLEIPSGALADRFSRKYVLLASSVVRALSFTSWLLIPNFNGFLLGFLLWGLGSALASGTTEALVYDELKRYGAEKQYAKVSGIMQSLRIAGSAAAGFVGAVIVSRGYNWLFGASIASLVVTAAVILRLPKARSQRSTGETAYYRYIKEGVAAAILRPRLLLLLVTASFITGIGALDEYYNLLFLERGLSRGQIGFWFGCIFLLSAVGSAVAHKFETVRINYGLFTVLWGGLLLAAVLGPTSLLPVCIALFTMVFYAAQVLLETSLQHQIPDKTRATTTSVLGFSEEIVALSVYGVFGLQGSRGMTFSFQLIAWVICAVGIFYVVASGAMRYRSKHFEALK